QQENRELQERLMVSEATVQAQAEQLKEYRDLLSESEGKGQAEEGKCATWPGKYNSLIQAQARELSHLRQRMREGQGVCHILTQHLGDTTKAFEELLRANDIDYYMGQSFREQLAQSTALAQRVVTKISGRKERFKKKNCFYCYLKSHRSIFPLFSPQENVQNAVNPHADSFPVSTQTGFKMLSVSVSFTAWHTVSVGFMLSHLFVDFCCIDACCCTDKYLF
uniref:Uncharacterized protein n=1 Tax=Haplochromis burtoni TaxID=8153 RepID=A0A3Q2WEP2_HAPBU